jgi:hypothetical protein
MARCVILLGAQLDCTDQDESDDESWAFHSWVVEVWKVFKG